MTRDSRRAAWISGLVLAFALVGLVLWLLRDGAGMNGGQRAAVATDAAPAAGSLPTAAAPWDDVADPVAGTATPIALPADTVAVPEPVGGRLVVRVTWERDGQPAADLHLRLFPFDLPDPHRAVVPGRTDGQGLWVLDPAPLGTVGVYTHRSASDIAEVHAGQLTELALVVPRGTLVRGLVVDPTGSPAPGAEVWLSDTGNNLNEGAVVALSDAAGRFELRDVSPFQAVGARGAASRRRCWNSSTTSRRTSWRCA